MLIKHYVKLTTADWHSILKPDTDGDYSGLPRCCGNIGHFRDLVEDLRQHGGLASPFLKLRLMRSWDAVVGGHPLEEWNPKPLAALKIIEQLKEGDNQESV